MATPKNKTRRKNGNKALFLKRFLEEPKRVASIIPSSRVLIGKVAKQMDHSRPRIIAEFGPGEGCHTREILRRAHPESQLYLFELDKRLAGYLAEEFSEDQRVTVLNRNCCELKDLMKERDIPHFDYVLSGIPFSLMDHKTKQGLMHDIHESLTPEGAFIIYQVTNELKRFRGNFEVTRSSWCPLNIPPMFVTVYAKNGKSSNGKSG